MFLSTFSALAGAITFASSVYAHGLVSGIIADGVYYEGYSPSFQYKTEQPKVVGWSIPQDQDTGFISPDMYKGADVICHKGATNGQASAKVSAGTSVELQWTPWPDSHHGPVIDYLANCNGDCTTVDKATLQFFKIHEDGLHNDDVVPGEWATDSLIANNNSWTVPIPSNIAPGSYVLRHEIIALHSAGQANGAQNYPQCINLEITGSGSLAPAGTAGESLYQPDEKGISINIYTSLSTYLIPGPSLYSGASAAAHPTGSSSSNASVSTSSPAGQTTSSPQPTSASPSSSAQVSPNSAGSGSSMIAPTGVESQSNEPYGSQPTGEAQGSAPGVASSKPCPSKQPAMSAPGADTAAPTANPLVDQGQGQPDKKKCTCKPKATGELVRKHARGF